MSSLLGQVRHARKGLEEVELANLMREQLQVLQNRRRDWDQRCKSKEAAERQFLAMGLDLARMPGLSNQCNQTQVLTIEAQNRLLGSGDLQVLTVDNLWTRLLSSADGANEAMAKAARAAWDAHIQALPAFEPPTAVESRVPRTPTNAQGLVRYRTLHAEFVALTRSIPATPSRLAEIESSVAGLQETLSGLTIDAPEAVRAFLRAAETTGARLALLTPEVLDWLSEHDNPARFVVRSAGGT